MTRSRQMMFTIPKVSHSRELKGITQSNRRDYKIKWPPVRFTLPTITGIIISDCDETLEFGFRLFIKLERTDLVLYILPKRHLHKSLLVVTVKSCRKLEIKTQFIAGSEVIPIQMLSSYDYPLQMRSCLEA